MTNPIDRLIGWINPRAGLARHHARQGLQRAYEAASPRDGWRPRRAGASANADHQADAKTLRTKARALVQNVPYIAAAMNTLANDTVGTGIMVRAIGVDKEKINPLWASWSKECDADGRLDLDGLIRMADMAVDQDGEVLVRLRPRRPSDGLTVPLQIQVLEIDWVDDTRMGGYQGNTIIQGIEYDQLGKVAAYWLWDQHPGDMVLMRGMKIQSSRVPAQNIIHVFDPRRPGQGRGITRLAPVITRTRDTQLYEDAELGRKNLETRLSVLASGDLSSMDNPAANGAGPGEGAGGMRELGELGGGQIFGMPAGMDFTVVEPKAAPGYVDYIKLQLHIISAAIGVPYEAITGDMSEVNFSSARVRLLAYRRQVQQFQWLILVPMLLRPISEAFIDAAQLAGKIRGNDKAVDFSMPKWDYVNPQQEVAADTAEIAAGLSTVSEKLRQRGYDPDAVATEWAADKKRFEDLGILETMLFLQKGNLPTPGTDQAGGPEPK